MQALSISLINYEGVAPLILRVILGVTLAFFAYKKIQGRGESTGSNSYIYGIIEMIIAVFLIIGLFTQISALLNALILIIKIGHKAKQRALFTNGINYYAILLAIAISIAFLSDGYLSVDTLIK